MIIERFVQDLFLPSVCDEAICQRMKYYGSLYAALRIFCVKLVGIFSAIRGGQEIVIDTMSGNIGTYNVRKY